MTFFLLLLPPLCAALLAFIVRPYRPWVGRVNGFISLVSLGAALTFAAHAIAGGEAPTWGISLGRIGLEDVLRADSLSALLMICVSAVGTLTLALSPGVGRESRYDAAHLSRYHIFINLFIAAMLLAVAANNVGVMWIAIEATTVFSAFLIPLKLSKASVEASWKYILIGSVGIALAFAGTVLAYFDFVALSGRVENALNWSVLLEIAPTLHGEVIQLAFVFLLIGYGTKAGIAPMHTWKPDAYGEAPAPLVALMSSALYAVAMYAIIRWKVVADVALGDHYTDNLLITLGLLSLVVATFSIVLATNYKRMLAYSSLEHSGLICLGLALGPLGAFAALLHLVNHTAAKSLMFFLIDTIERKFPSPLIANTRGLLKVLPWTGALFACGLMFLIGLPPGGIFVSEYSLFRAGFALNHPWLMGAVLVLLAIAFISFINILNQMLFGAAPADVAVGEYSGWRIVLPLLNLTLLVILGLTLPAPLLTLLNQSVSIIAR
jgi:hydrogenase-4 component F